jgi:hypothetical protein
MIRKKVSHNIGRRKISRRNKVTPRKKTKRIPGTLKK